MAPKLPPPANTKAVLVGPAWFATDKASVAPVLDAWAKDHATLGGIYSSRRARRAIDKSWFNGEDDPCPDAASRRKITGASRMGSAEPVQPLSRSGHIWNHDTATKIPQMI